MQNNYQKISYIHFALVSMNKVAWQYQLHNNQAPHTAFDWIKWFFQLEIIKPV